MVEDEDEPAADGSREAGELSGSRALTERRGCLDNVDPTHSGLTDRVSGEHSEAVRVHCTPALDHGDERGAGSSGA